MLEDLKHGMQKYPDLLSGFDLVNEEESTAPIRKFMPQILAAMESRYDFWKSPFDVELLQREI